jgi:hypothetical protein
MASRHIQRTQVNAIPRGPLLGSSVNWFFLRYLILGTETDDGSLSQPYQIVDELDQPASTLCLNLDPR